jgi:tetratricopeptide (TPR) repeat protein
MQSYGVRDVEKLLRLPRSTLRALIDAGFVTPTRGARNALRFSFQDLILLRTAQALVDAKIPKRRILQSLKEMRRRLPDSMPLSGLRVRAVGKRVVVSDREGRWRQADSGQYLLAFEGDPAEGSLDVIEPAAQPEPLAVDWFERGVEVENDNMEAARAAYEKAIAADPTHIDARINLGRLLHHTGRLAQAERVYRDAIRADAVDAVLYYNFAILLEDIGRVADAMRLYESALRLDPELADGHYNLALLYEARGRQTDAIRHMARYRKLLRS